ncbi:MAG: hypothetical protein WAO52_07945 [Prolixibacteraceae bacterium]
MKKVLFKESQQFRQWWQIVMVLLFTIPEMVISLYALWMQAVEGVSVGKSSAPNFVLIGTSIAMVLVIWVFFALKLEVEIDSEGIHFRFSPLIRKTRLISREEIQRFEIRKYKPIIDYGGRGIKKRFKWGKAYSVSGNIGLQLYLKNGRKVLFGTQRSQAIGAAMSEMMKV